MLQTQQLLPVGAFLFGVENCMRIFRKEGMTQEVILVGGHLLKKAALPQMIKKITHPVVL